MAGAVALSSSVRAFRWMEDKETGHHQGCPYLEYLLFLRKDFPDSQSFMNGSVKRVGKESGPTEGRSLTGSTRSSGTDQAENTLVSVPQSWARPPQDLGWALGVQGCQGLTVSP